MPAVATRHLHVELVMGTAVTLDVRGGSDPESAVAEAVRSLHEIDAAFSPYRPNSEVSRFARGEDPYDGLSGDLRWVVEECERLRLVTRGGFDAWATGTFDPSGLVKGWAVQRAAALLATEGATDFCLTAGGDVATLGSAAPGLPWRIGVRHPLDPDALAAIVEARDGLAVATSGAYERGDHIRDPRDGRAPRGVLSVTVTGPDLGTADAYATAAYAMGRKGPAWTAGLDGYEAMTIFSDETVLTTGGFPA